jgi:hypothetical protein
MLLIFGLIYWCMAGVMCWAAEAIQVEKHAPHQPAPSIRPPQAREWHSASEFRLPGGARLLLNYPRPHGSHETLAHYGRERYGERGEKP